MGKFTDRKEWLGGLEGGASGCWCLMCTKLQSANESTSGDWWLSNSGNARNTPQLDTQKCLWAQHREYN